MAHIRQASIHDVEEIVCIHMAAFPDFFLTSLGTGFLKLYYSTFIKSGDGVVYCAVKNDRMVGFSASSFVSRGFNARLIKKNLVRYGGEALKQAFIHPRALIRLIKNLNKETKDPSVQDEGLYAELYSIAILPECQGQGIGRLLLSVTESGVRDFNSQMSLTTDYYNNDNALAFYRALGYREYYDFVTYPNRRMWRMIKHLG